MAKERRRIYQNHHGIDPDLRAYLKHEACPDCGESNYIEAANGVEDYVDDELMCMTEFGPRWFPVKQWSCGNCGCQFRTYWGTVAIDIIEPSDITPLQ
jgi:ribosomal protein S27AE